MNKPLLVCLSLLLFSTQAFAQKSGSIHGSVTDMKTHKPVAGVSIELLPADTAKKVSKSTVSDDKGAFTLDGVPFGEYSIKANSLGFAPFQDKLAVSSPSVNFRIAMNPQAEVALQAVNVEVQAIRTSQKGDTVVYNAAAFKVTKDADAEGMLSKMPGITITDGQVEAQGEQVQKVLVDGREFFGIDVAATIKNIPAEAIDKVEVYNRLSDQAQLTGIDDGEGYKAINIVTKPSMRTGAFGKVYAGYGTWDKYIVGGSINVFTGKNRISLIGLANNVNQQNFSTEDILGVVNTGSGGGGSRYSSGRSSGRSGGGDRGSSSTGNFMMPPMAGVSKVGSIGLNYSTQYKDKLDFTGSYFFNETINHRETTTQRQYFPDDASMIRSDSSFEQSDPHNFNHRFNAKLDWKIDNNNVMSIRPSFSFQNNSSYTTSSSYTRKAPMADPAAQTLLNAMRRAVNSKTVGYNGSLLAVYVHKFARPGRTLSLDGTFSASTNDPTNENYSTTLYYRPDSLGGNHTNINNIRNVGHTFNYGIEGNATYTEPITSKAQFVLRYRMSYNYSDANRKTYGDSTRMDYFAPGFVPDFYPDFNIRLSNVYHSNYLKQRVGTGIRYGGQKTNLVATLYYQHSSLDGDQTFPIQANPKISTGFNNFLYSGILTQTFNPQNTLRVYASSSTDSPSVSQLQNYIDNRNTQYVSTGNPDLKQIVNHRIAATYNRSNVTKGRTFMLMGSFSLAQNDIVDETIYVADSSVNYMAHGQMVHLPAFAQFTKPVNVGSGSWNARGGAVFGTPIKPIRSNLNINLGYSFSKSPSFITNVTPKGNILPTLKNIQNYTVLSTGATLGSNISTNLDFSLSYNFGYNIVNNLIDTGNNDNKFWSQTANFRIKWITVWDLTFTGSAFYYKNKGITSQYTQEYCLVNAFIGKQIFKNRRGEINVGVNDLLNQNRNFSRPVSSQYISNVTNNVIPRYFSVQFIYNLRTFKGQGPSQNKSVVGDQLDEGHSYYRSGGPGGPPPGGPGGPGGGTYIRGPR